MSIWYYDSIPKKQSFRRGTMGLDAYLYLPGPSLAQITTDVRVEGTMAFAINTAYPKVKPHVWVGMDKPDCYDHRLINEAFTKVFRGTYFNLTNNGKMLKQYPQTYFADVEKPSHGIEEMFLNKSEDIFLSWFKHTLGVVLHLMVYMGAQKIHFVGCDLGGKSDYYDDRVLSNSQREYNRRLYNQQKTFIQEFCQLSSKYGVECISCTQSSPINEFMPYFDYTYCIEQSKLNCGKVRPVKHVLEVTDSDLEKSVKCINWKEPTRDRGILVMCDKDQEWLLPWWEENYHQYNHFPVQFVDIGLSEEGIKLCKTHGCYTKLPAIELKNWFKKPFALKLTQFKQTLYMDLDCEVRGSIFELFDTKGFCVAMDVFNNFSIKKETVNSGVVLYDWNSPIVDRWADQVIKTYGKYRGDQDCLDSIEKDFKVLPQEYNWMRLRGENDKAIIFHHTGTTGKETIKKQINQCNLTGA